MKSVVAVAAFAAVATASWSDADPVKETTTTTAAESTWLDTDLPVDPTSTTVSYWGDVPAPTTTTTSSWDPTWKDDPVDETSTTANTWSDYPVDETTTSTATLTWSDYTPVDPASTSSVWAAVPAPVAPTSIGECKVVTVTKTGTAYVWVPAAGDATWSDAPVDPTSTSTWADGTWSDVPVEETTTTSWDPTWSDVPVEETSTTSWDPTWSDVPVDPTTTSTWADGTWSDVPVKETSTTTSSTTKKPVWTTSTTSSAKATTTSASKPSNCGCSFDVETGIAADASKAKFWSKDPTKQTTQPECQALCDANEKCEAALWVGDDAYKNRPQDYKICWQTSGLGGATGAGGATVAYKKSCSGTCSASYNS